MKEMEDVMEKAGKTFAVVWAGSAIVGLTFTGFLCWAIYKLVTHLTG